MKLSVIKLDGKAAGDVELSDAVFGITDIRGDILARYVNWQLAKRRAGTHKVQTRNENSRTGKKMAGQLGNETITTQNLTVVRVDVERGLIMVKGAVPGHEGSWVKVRDAHKKPFADLPFPGSFKTKGGAAAAPAETPAEEPAAVETVEGGEA